MYRRIAVLASLAVMAAMFVGSSTANAAVGDGGVCIFEGLAGNLNPGIQDIAEDLNDPNPLDIERGTYNFNGDATCVGKVGNQIFAPVADTNGDGTPDIPPAVVAQNVGIVSNGHYDNILCGTGFAHDQNGTGTIVTAKAGTLGGGASITNVGYEIPFILGNGPILIGTGTNLSGIFDGPPLSTLFPHDTKYLNHGGHGPVTGNYVGVGAVHITAGNPPTDTDNCAVDNNDGDNLPANPPLPRTPATPQNDGTTNTFLVAGAFVAVGK